MPYYTDKVRICPVPVSYTHLFVEDFDLGTGENGGLGMICGGKVKVLFYSVKSKDTKIASFLKEALKMEEEKKPYWLLLPFSKGYPKIESHLEEGRGHCRILEKYENDETQKIYAEEFNFDGKVYIFGGGHLAQELVPVLSHLGFWCMVMDDREEYTALNLFPGDVYKRQRYMPEFLWIDRKAPGWRSYKYV